MIHSASTPRSAQVGQARGDAGQVADAVAVAVGEAADVDLVDDGVAPPGRRALDRSNRPCGPVFNAAAAGAGSLRRAPAAEQRRVDGDPHVLGRRDDATVGVVQRGGGEGLAPLAPRPRRRRRGARRSPGACRCGRSSARAPSAARSRSPAQPPDAVERRPVAGDRGAGVRRRRRCESSARLGAASRWPRRDRVGPLTPPRAGEDPQAVALLALGAAGEAGRERVEGVSGVRRLGGARLGRRPGRPRPGRVDALRAVAMTRTAEGRGGDAVRLGLTSSGVSSGGGWRSDTSTVGHGRRGRRARTRGWWRGRPAVHRRCPSRAVRRSVAGRSARSPGHCATWGAASASLAAGAVTRGDRAAMGHNGR